MSGSVYAGILPATRRDALSQPLAGARADRDACRSADAGRGDRAGAWRTASAWRRSQARVDAAGLRRQGAQPRRSAATSRCWRLHADEPRGRVLDSRARCVRRSRLSRTSPTTTARGSTCSGRSTRPAASMRSSAPRAAEQSAVGEELAAARSDLRLEITRAFWALVTAREAESVLARSLDAHQRAGQRSPQPLQLRIHSAQ